MNNIIQNETGFKEYLIERSDSVLQGFRLCISPGTLIHVCCWFMDHYPVSYHEVCNQIECIKSYPTYSDGARKAVKYEIELMREFWQKQEDFRKLRK